MAGFLVPGQALAADVPASAAPSFDHLALLSLVVGLGMLVSIINGALGIWDKLKPKPPLHQQFAPLDHEHAGVITEAECTHRHDEFVREQRHLVKHATLDREAIQRQLDTVVITLRQEIKDNDRKAEDRASGTHKRIDAISQPLNQMIGRFESHIQEHQS